MSTPDDALPTVALLAFGGTIASATGATAGVSPQVSAADLVAAVPELAGVALLRVTQVRQVPSVEVTVADLVALVAQMRAAVDAGATGVVVTQGTDTLEEAAYVVDLLWDRPEPVVFTGAMRAATDPGADGPANLVSSVRLAVSSETRGLGVLVCLGDEVHAARHVRKAHTSSPAAFTSPGRGPLGWISEGRPVVAWRPAGARVTVRVEPGTPLPQVAVLRVGLDEDPRLLVAAGGLGYDGIVLEGVGGGHVPRALVPALVDLVDRVPVLLASRTGAGRVLEQTYGYPGGDIDLVHRGLVPVGTLDAAKARLLLVLGLASGLDRAGVEELVRRAGG